MIFILMGNNIDDNSTGYIYKLCINEDDDIFYIGSTRRELRHRLAEHKYDIKNERHNKRKIKHFKDNINNLKIIELEKCFNTKEQLKFRERDYIDKFQKVLIEPRLSIHHQFWSYFSIEALGEFKHQNTSQFINFQNDFLGIERRRWQLANDDDIPVIESKQGSFGISYNRSGLLLNIDAYYKNIDGITTQSQEFKTKYEFTQDTWLESV